MASQDAQVSLTERLQRYLRGDLTEAEVLIGEIEPTLKELARKQLLRERYRAPLCNTELVNELWLRSLSKGGWQINDRSHFYALASRVMRRILVDLARKRLAEVHGGGEDPIPLDEARGSREPWVQDAAKIIEIDLALQQLEKQDPEGARIIEMLYFMGLTNEEAAEQSGLSVKQVRSRAEKARKALNKLLRSKHKP